MKRKNTVLKKNISDILHHYYEGGGYPVRVNKYEAESYRSYKNITITKLRGYKDKDDRCYSVKFNKPFPKSIEADYWKLRYLETEEELSSIHDKLQNILNGVG